MKRAQVQCSVDGRRLFVLLPKAGFKKMRVVQGGKISFENCKRWQRLKLRSNPSSAQLENSDCRLLKKSQRRGGEKNRLEYGIIGH